MKLRNLYVPLGVIAVGGVFVGLCAFSRYRLRSVPGTPIGEVFVGETLIVIDHVAVGGKKDGRPTTEDNRLVALDAKTGERLATHVGEYVACWAGTPRVFCADKYDRVELLDPRTLDTVATAEELIAGAKLAKPSQRFEKVTNGVIVKLVDGRGAQIDPATLEVTPLETVPWYPLDTGRHECDTTDRLRRETQTLVLESGTRRKLTTDPPPPAESATPRAPAPSFLDGEFLQIDSAVVVVHKETVDGPHAISRIDETTFAIKWTIQLPGACRTFGLAGSILAVAVDNRDDRAVGIDLDTGRVVWEHSY